MKLVESTRSRIEQAQTILATCNFEYRFDFSIDRDFVAQGTFGIKLVEYVDTLIGSANTTETLILKYQRIVIGMAG